MSEWFIGGRGPIGGTSASRMLFAFSRDRAVPGHQLWRRVSSNRVPHMAVIAIVVAAAALMLPTLYNFFIGYYVATGIAVIGSTSPSSSP